MIGLNIYVDLPHGGRCYGKIIDKHLVSITPPIDDCVAYMFHYEYVILWSEERQNSKEIELVSHEELERFLQEGEFNISSNQSEEAYL